MPYSPRPRVSRLHTLVLLSTYSSLEAFSCYKKDVAVPRALTDEGGTSGPDRCFLSYCSDLLFNTSQ
ncbi:hypothetical protein ECANGB1_2697 [Enterospora canceri]|uniref:Secreted protein n=2 Tax=Enterospora canceri TaxID=1081671 RepID=A0A1Y1S8J6_9MICR|nr:hypothetical protein ECANGB1_2697 [Enterospora canceri]